MRFAARSILCLGFGISLLAVEVQAFVKKQEPSSQEGNIYEIIPRRNVFDLHDPVPDPVKIPAPPPPMQIRLTGITTILSGKRALLMVRPGAVSGKTPEKEESYILSEGERQGPIWLQEINERTGTVKLECEGIVNTVALEVLKPQNPGPAPAATPAPPPAFMARHQLPMTMPPPLPR